MLRKKPTGNDTVKPVYRNEILDVRVSLVLISDM